MELSVDLSGLQPDTAHRLIKGLQYEDKAQHDLGVIEQLRLKRLADALAQPGFNNDVGRTFMVLSPEQAAMARRIYGDLCFADPDFSRFLVKNHPEFGVKDVPSRVQSGYTGRSDSLEREVARA